MKPQTDTSVVQTEDRELLGFDQVALLASIPEESTDAGTTLQLMGRLLTKIGGPLEV